MQRGKVLFCNRKSPAHGDFLFSPIGFTPAAPQQVSRQVRSLHVGEA